MQLAKNNRLKTLAAIAMVAGFFSVSSWNQALAADCYMCDWDSFKTSTWEICDYCYRYDVTSGYWGCEPGANCGDDCSFCNDPTCC